MIQKKLANILFSTRLMAILFVVFAVSMAVGTFVENSYTTATARVWIYNAWWFEAIMLLFVINFCGNIAKYRLWRKEKWSTLLLHLSFILILVGAGVTRYIGFEGVMPIREGETTNIMLSERTYLTTLIDGDVDGSPLRKSVENAVLLAPGANNHHTFTSDFKGQDVRFEIVDFIESAKQGITPSKTGKNYLKLVESGEGHRDEHYLEEGQVASIHNILFAYNKPTEGAVNITMNKNGSQMSAPFEGNYMRMADQKKGQVYKDSTQTLMMRSLYSVGGLQFVFPDPVVRGDYDIIPKEKKTENDEDGVIVNVSSKGETKQVKLLGAKGISGDYKDVSVGGLDFHVRYGSKEYKLPFAIRLNDFIASKYPGTELNPTPSYSSFKSKVDLIDDGETTKHDIYMNHVLDHKGYRFFQSSFQPDEKGTVLSVNHDFWGTWITYIGYFLLYLGLMVILFDKGSRFGELERKLDKLKAKKKKMLTVLLLLLSFSGFSQNASDTLVTDQKQETGEIHADHAVQFPKEKLDSTILANAVPPKEAGQFGRLIIQDIGGRMKPINTYSSELLRKVSKSVSYEGLNSDQVLLSIARNPSIWYNVPLIKIEAKNDSLHKILKIKKGEKRVALAQFFDATGTYRLAPYLEEAYRAKVPNQFQKDFKKADEKVNLLYSALQGKVLRIFPIPDAENNKWLSYPEIIQSQGKYPDKNDSTFVANAMPVYMQTLQMAEKSHDYKHANQVLESITAFQKKYGEDIMPSDKKVSAEIFYNDHDVFRSLYWQYALVGVFMMFFVILQIFYNNKGINAMIWVGKIAMIILFLMHTGGLIMRWYISGHAPWTDAFESMIYVGWATAFFGIAFGRKSDLTIASTGFVAAIILMIAHGNWMDPAITNLVPVLDSYWLMIHVAVIVASYGPFTLGMILALVSLFLMIMTNEKNLKKMKLNIRELTIITEMALTVGLVMLAIGTFLGGQWANESWGRYWGWDPKETWAFISVMVYAFVIHMRLVPGLRSRFAFNWATVFAYSSIMMTYFGVNFYLTGLHSYASGDQIISYKFILISLALWFVLGFFAYRKFKKYYKK